MANTNKRLFRKASPKEKKPSKSPVTVELLPDGIFKFHGGKGGFNIVERKNKALEPYGKCIYNYGLLLELVPGDKAAAINQTIGNSRFVHNNYLSERIRYYEEQKKTLTVAQYQKEFLSGLKKEKEFLQKSDKFVYENACRNVDTAYQNFFSGKAGFPKFASSRKPNGNSFTTNYTNHNIELKMENGLPYLKLPKIGDVRFVLPKGKTLADLQPHGVSIKSATVTRTNDKYRVSLLMETVIDRPVFPTVLHARDILAVDLGLKVFGIFGNREETYTVPNPRWIRLHEKRLRRFQQSLSRKQYDPKTHKGSKNWEKARAKVTREQRRISDQRRDFHHKLAGVIADNYHAFICEDLAVKNMMQNRRLAKSIASVGWSQFLTILKYKMERAGKYFRKIDRWYASSQTCGCCGYKNTEVKDLAVREWTCPQCGTYHDRDVNAMQNIYSKGAELLRSEGIQITA